MKRAVVVCVVGLAGLAGAGIANATDSPSEQRPSRVSVVQPAAPAAPAPVPFDHKAYLDQYMRDWAVMVEQPTPSHEVAPATVSDPFAGVRERHARLQTEERLRDLEQCVRFKLIGC